MCSAVCFKEKMKRSSKIFRFFLCPSQKPFCPILFGGLNKMFFFFLNFEFSFLRMYIYVIGRYLQIKKKYIFKVPLIFFTPPYCTRVLHQMYEWMMRHCIRVNLTHLVFFYSDFLESGKAELTAKFSRWPGNRGCYLQGLGDEIFVLYFYVAQKTLTSAPHEPVITVWRNFLLSRRYTTITHFENRASTKTHTILALLYCR